MKEKYKILYRGGMAEIEEKKSRFIATLSPVDSEEEAYSFIAEIKKKYWDASHNCTAFLVGENHELSRCSDDGEPAQTAGRPMLGVLEGEEIHNVCAVVTRYFGGTLLGTGGLVRAYARAVQEGLKNCQTVEKCLARKLKVGTDYNGLGRIQYILGELGISILAADYSDKAELTALVPVGDEELVKKKLIEGTSGRCILEPAGEVYFGLAGKEIIIL